MTSLIIVATTIVHGDLDINVPPALARWLADQVPGSTLDLIEDAGHLFAVTHPALVLHHVAV